MQYSQIIWASLLGYVLWGERPTLYTTMGIAVIVAAGVALLFVAGRHAPRLSAA
jgi:S-adenosylmethionine uptake transporter